jgi:hypothetical protein
VRLEASTKPHVHRKFEIFWTNIASTMACSNFKNGPKKGLGPLGVKHVIRTLHDTKVVATISVSLKKILHPKKI